MKKYNYISLPTSLNKLSETKFLAQKKVFELNKRRYEEQLFKWVNLAFCPQFSLLEYLDIRAPKEMQLYLWLTRVLLALSDEILFMDIDSHYSRIDLENALVFKRPELNSFNQEILNHYQIKGKVSDTYHVPKFDEELISRLYYQSLKHRELIKDKLRRLLELKSKELQKREGLLIFSMELEHLEVIIPLIEYVAVNLNSYTAFLMPVVLEWFGTEK